MPVIYFCFCSLRSFQLVSSHNSQHILFLVEAQRETRELCMCLGPQGCCSSSFKTCRGNCGLDLWSSHVLAPNQRLMLN